MVSHQHRRLQASRLRWLYQCQQTKRRLGHLCLQIGATAASRLSGASLPAVKYWRRKILNPNFHPGE